MLLRALETKRYRPTGGSKDKKADVRIIAATNEDLQTAIAEKRFRADLYQRLKEYTLHIPPLRECKEDDITLSSKIDFKSLLPLFLSLIRESGFAINHKKTHYKTKNPIVTGVICQNNRLLPPLGYKKKKARLRQELQSGKKSVEPQLRGLSTYLERISKT